jgi:hypothetical protein
MSLKVMIALAAAASWVLVPQTASAGYNCYGVGSLPGSARCAGVGLGLQAPRWYYSDFYPYWIYFTQSPYLEPLGGVGGCHLIRRPVLDPRSGWVNRTVQVCD